MKTARSVLGTIALAAVAGGIWLAARSGAQTQTARFGGVDWEEAARRNERDYGFKGAIAGRVTLDDGKPAAGFLVFARFEEGQSGAQGEGGAVTDAQGRYRIHGLNPQGFQVQPQNGGKPYLPDPSRLIHLDKFPNVTAANLNFTLHLGPQITVRVRDAQTNKPVSGLTVEANQSEYTSPFPMGVTDERGEFRFRVGQRETEIRFDDRQLNDRRISAAPGSDLYRRVNLTKLSGNADAVWEVKTYSETQGSEVTFRGAVTGPDGKAVAGATVRMSRRNTTRQFQAITDAKGAFSLKTHRMELSEYGDVGGQTRPGILLLAEKGDLSAVHFATPEETWSQISVRLSAEKRPSVSGRAVSPAGRPMANVPIRYFEDFLNVEAFFQRDGGVTDAEGRFTVKRLFPDAYYRFTFGGPPQYGKGGDFGVTVSPDVLYTVDNLRLKGAERRDIGEVIVLPADNVITGRITAHDGRPPQGKLMIKVEGKRNWAFDYPDADGRFRIEKVVQEPLTLYVYRSEDADGHFFRSSPGSQDEAAHQAAHAGDQDIRIILP